MLRDRALGDVPAHLERGLRAAGLEAARVLHVADEEAAAGWLLDWARAGDVVVLPVHTKAVREHIAAALGPDIWRADKSD